MSDDVPSQDVGDALEDILPLVGTPAYWADQSLQDRHLELLRARETGSPVPAMRGDPETEVAEWRSELLPEVVAGWEGEPGGFRAGLERMQGVIRMVAAGAGNEHEAVQFVESFQHLPESVRVAVLAEAKFAEPGYIRPASDDQMAWFRTFPGGQEVIQLWGRDARRRVAIVDARLESIGSRLSDADRASFVRWGDSLAPRALQCFAWALGNV